MPAFTKPSEGTVRTFEASVAGLKGVERRTMFGYPSIFLNGNMLACVFQDRIMLRLSEADRAEAMAAHAAKLFEPSPGRPMKEYVELPPPITKNPAVMQRWFERGRTYVATLPAKKPKKK
jgi:TfoX/Sxy family transcriptional regulator of competence genes